MCIIVDTCCLAPVFDVECKDHPNFKSVLDWIVNGKGKFLYGGTTYEKELKHRFASLLKEFTKVGKARALPKDDVDAYEKALKTKVADKDFDDPHLIAMVAVSGCKLICTTEKRAVPYLKNQKLYPQHIEPPKLYSSSVNKNLLCDQHMADICKPCEKTTKVTRTSLSKALGGKI